METLEGKKAGLQNATALREENEQIRRREDDMFRKMAEKQKHDGITHFENLFYTFKNSNAFYFLFFIFFCLFVYKISFLQITILFVIGKPGAVPNSTEKSKKIMNRRNAMPNEKWYTIVGVQV